MRFLKTTYSNVTIVSIERKSKTVLTVSADYQQQGFGKVYSYSVDVADKVGSSKDKYNLWERGDMDLLCFAVADAIEAKLKQ